MGSLKFSNELLIMKFPAVFNEGQSKQIKKIKPDIVIFDDKFVNSLSKISFSNSVLCLYFGHCFNSSLTHVKLPKYLKKIKFGNKYSKSLDYVDLPETLEIIEFGENFAESLFSVKFPNGLKEICFTGKYNLALPQVLPSELEKLYLSSAYDYSINKFIVPEKLKYLQISGIANNSPLINNLPNTCKYLEITLCIQFDMCALPQSLETLYFNIDSGNFNSFMFPNKKNVVQTNLPVGITKIILQDASLLNLIPKIPFGCKVVDWNNRPITV